MDTKLIGAICLLLSFPLMAIAQRDAGSGVTTKATRDQPTAVVSPLTLVKRVADKIVRETSFGFSLSPQIPSAAVQTLDFAAEFPGRAGTVGYALSYLTSPRDAEVRLGISHRAPLRVWVNDQEVYSGESPTGNYEEIAYDIYRFPSTVPAQLKAGDNRLLIKSLLPEKDGRAQLAVLTQSGLIEPATTFGVRPLVANPDLKALWLMSGPFTSTASGSAMSERFPPELKTSTYYALGDGFATWRAPRTVLVLTDVVPSEASFKKHSYFEWHYANGQMMLAMVQLAEAAKDERYSDYAKRFCATTLDSYKYFQYQYDVLSDKGGFNYRLFRKAMLDDSSAPALPYAELYLRGQLPASRFLIDEMAAFVSHRQSRLKDGTLCRPEPEADTVWADDLFMSVPFLLRYAEVSRDQRVYDDAARQVVLFHKHLFDSTKGIASHAWFAGRRQPSVAFWGRANGWMVWATTEALLRLPKGHADYQAILGIYREQMRGLVRYQSANGMWHQVLDHPESYEETSSTAMFTLALARGLLNGWIDRKYEENMRRGWSAIEARIGEEGTVSGICQGTEVGNTLEFYFERKTPPHDPRGLGAVITAGIEVQRVLDGRGRRP